MYNAMSSNKYLLELCNITKKFPGVVALNNVDFGIKKQEIRGLVGENGAGKSTLIKIISGIYKPDNGEIYFQKDKIRDLNPKKAIELGISLVPQTLDFFPHLTIAENLLIEDLPVNFGIINKKELNERTKSYLSIFGLNLNVAEIMGNLNFTQQKLILIIKALIMKSKILILDEPTASLHKEEIDILFKYIRDFRKNGATIIYISHHLEEIFGICDTATILKDGRVVSTDVVKNLNMDILTEKMVGRKIKIFNKVDHKIGNSLLKIKDLSKNKKFINISLDIKRGEVVSIAGVKGSGKEDIIASLFGFIKIDSGDVLIEQKKISKFSPEKLIKHGVYYLPDDRHKYGLCLILSVRNNISMCSLSQVSNKLGFINNRSENKLALKYIRDLSINTPSIFQELQYLSGGNQQKVVFSKYINPNPKLLVLHEPTAGIDVGSKAEIHKIIEDLARKGIAIILFTSELSEMLNLSNRILVLYKGRVIKEIMRNDKDFNRKQLMLYMEGGIT
jgi:ABC-type sugar transport system ATPase subunit